MSRTIRRFGRATTFTAPGVLFDTEPAAPAGGGAPPAAPAAPAAPPAPAPVATSPAPGAPAPAPAAQEPPAPAAEWDGKVESLPKAAQKIITDLRKADGDERVAKKTLDAIMATLNPDGGAAEKDPVKLAEQLAAKDAEAKASAQTAQSTALELAIYKAAIAAGAKPDALTDSRTFMEKAAGIDLTDSTALAAAITEAVKNNPSLKAARVAGQSSVEHAGGSGEGANHTLDAQIAEAEKAGNHVLAISLKRQQAYTPTANA